MKRPNILFVVLDATRADVCSCYGFKQRTTPVLDQLAKEGVLYEQAISPAPWTLPAVASLFTGLYPSQTDICNQFKLNDHFPTLAQLLSNHGYATFGITNNSWLSTNFGLQRGFKVMHKQWQLLQTRHEINKLVLTKGDQRSSWAKTVLYHLSRGNPFKNTVNMIFAHFIAYRHDLGASRILSPLKRWISSQQKPWFAYVHYLEAHLPYKPPLKWATRFTDDLERARKWIKADQWRSAWRHIAGIELLSEEDLAMWRSLYLAEVAYTDYYLGELVNWLRNTRQLDNTLLIVVADHGENLGEHGLLNHQYCVYDTLLKVPMVIRYPALFPTGKRITYPVQTLDLFNTILEIAQVDTSTTSSNSLLSDDNSPRAFVIAEYGIPRMPHSRDLTYFGIQSKYLRQFIRGFTAIRTDTHKLIVSTDGNIELFAWKDDPGEENNLAHQEPEVAQNLLKLLNNWQQQHKPSPPDKEAQNETKVPPEVKARLRALGYIE